MTDAEEGGRSSPRQRYEPPKEARAKPLRMLLHEKDVQVGRIQRGPGAPKRRRDGTYDGVVIPLDRGQSIMISHDMAEEIDRRPQPVYEMGVRVDDAIFNHDLEKLQKNIDRLQGDPRSGAQKVLRKAKNNRPKLQQEHERLQTMLKYEREIIEAERKRLEEAGVEKVEKELQNFIIIGTDEVGVGPLAGPCVAGACVLDLSKGACVLAGLNDSKKVGKIEREMLADKLKEECIYYAIEQCTAAEVDDLNPRQASMEAMRRAVVRLIDDFKLSNKRVHLLVDYHTVPNVPECVTGQTSMPKGDAKSQSIAAASILAKVWRDEYMEKLHEKYPEFGFDKNAGYGTKQHLDALKQGHLCPEHRHSFAPVRTALEKTQQKARTKHRVEKDSEIVKDVLEETQKEVDDVEQENVDGQSVAGVSSASASRPSRKRKSSITAASEAPRKSQKPLSESDAPNKTVDSSSNTSKPGFDLLDFGRKLLAKNPWRQKMDERIRKKPATAG